MERGRERRRGDAMTKLTRLLKKLDNEKGSGTIDGYILAAKLLGLYVYRLWLCGLIDSEKIKATKAKKPEAERET